MGSTGQKPITLSICMMVKNEEENLKRCLPSLKGIADELIIVDTGSTDNTIEVAKSAGAKVYEHPWEDDFSKHRNQSISYAKGDWVFIIDADEELFLENNKKPKAVKKWLSKLPSTCMACAVVLSDIQNGMQAMRFNTVRLFRNGFVKYEGIVHNTPKILKGKSDAALCPFIKLTHYGYDLSPEKQAEKRKRTEGLLAKRIEKNKDDIAAYFYLVQAYTAYGEYSKAAKNIEEYLKAADRTGLKFNDSIYCTAISVYRKLGDKVKAREWLLAGLKALPNDLDILMNMTEYGVWVQDLEIMTKGAKGFLKLYDEYQKNPVISGNRFTYSNSPECACYCMFHLSMGMFQQGCYMLDLLKSKLNETNHKFCEGLNHDISTVLNSFGLKKEGINTINTQQTQHKIVNLSARG